MRWRRHRSEQDFEEEIRSHIAHEWDRLIATGVAPDEARVLAERAFGDMTVALSRFGTVAGSSAAASRASSRNSRKGPGREGAC